MTAAAELVLTFWHSLGIQSVDCCRVNPPLSVKTGNAHTTDTTRGSVCPLVIFKHHQTVNHDWPLHLINLTLHNYYFGFNGQIQVSNNEIIPCIFVIFGVLQIPVAIWLFCSLS